MRSSCFKTILTVVVLSFLLVGCSTRFYYNQLDWLVPWYLDDYVTIENDQQDAFTASVDAVLDWHRATQLRRYADFLQIMSNDLRDSLSQHSIDEQKVAKYFLHLNEFVETLFTEFGHEFAPWVVQMNSQQQAQLIKNLAIKSEEYNKKYILIGQIKSKALSAKKVRKFFDGRLGGLSSNQEQLINQWSTQTDWLSPGFYENRQAWQAHLEGIFNEKNTSKKAELVESMFKNRRQFWSKGLHDKFRHNQQVTVAFIVRLLNSLDSYQEKSLLKELKKYEDDFRLLASQ